MDILDDLHNNGDDLDSSMLHASNVCPLNWSEFRPSNDCSYFFPKAQLNDYDKEALLNENHEMTIVEPKKTDKFVILL